MVEPSKKEELFESIAPKPSGPMIITTRTDQSAGGSKFAWFLVLVFAAAGAYFYWQNSELTSELAENQRAMVLSGQETITEEPERSVVEKVGQLIALPQNQQFNLLQVTDPEKYKASYPDIGEGDYLLTFNTLELAYDPDRDILLYVKNLQSIPSTNAEQVSSSEARLEQGALRLEIRNGAGVAGLAAATAETFKGVQGYEVKSVGNANNIFAKTVVVNLTGKNVSSLERQFNTVSVSQVPKGEKNKCG
jgi:hypothetical protein